MRLVHRTVLVHGRLDRESTCRLPPCPRAAGVASCGWLAAAAGCFSRVSRPPLCAPRLGPFAWAAVPKPPLEHRVRTCCGASTLLRDNATRPPIRRRPAAPDSPPVLRPKPENPPPGWFCGQTTETLPSNAARRPNRSNLPPWWFYGKPPETPQLVTARLAEAPVLRPNRSNPRATTPSSSFTPPSQRQAYSTLAIAILPDLTDTIFTMYSSARDSVRLLMSPFTVSVLRPEPFACPPRPKPTHAQPSPRSIGVTFRARPSPRTVDRHLRDDATRPPIRRHPAAPDSPPVLRPKPENPPPGWFCGQTTETLPSDAARRPNRSNLPPWWFYGKPPETPQLVTARLAEAPVLRPNRSNPHATMPSSSFTPPPQRQAYSTLAIAILLDLTDAIFTMYSCSSVHHTSRPPSLLMSPFTVSVLRPEPFACPPWPKPTHAQPSPRSIGVTFRA
nr:unnamed protein product [Digitaria exilis]